MRNARMDLRLLILLPTLPFVVAVLAVVFLYENWRANGHYIPLTIEGD